MCTARTTGALFKIPHVRYTVASPQAAQALYEPHKQHIYMASNYKGLYGIFYKISMEVVKSVNSQ